MAKINSRQKGHSWERYVANYLQEKTGAKCQRLLEFQEGFGVDIKTELPLAVQCKCSKSSGLAFTGYKEAAASAIGTTPGTIPTCFFKWSWKGRKPSEGGEFVILNLDDFMEIFTAYLSGR